MASKSIAGPALLPAAASVCVRRPQVSATIAPGWGQGPYLAGRGLVAPGPEAGPWLPLQCVATAMYPLLTPALGLYTGISPPPQELLRCYGILPASQAEASCCFSQASLAKRRPVTGTTWFMPLHLPNGPAPDLSTQGSFIHPLLPGRFVDCAGGACESRAAGAPALFSASENASCCTRFGPRSASSTPTLIYHLLTLITGLFFFSKPSTKEQENQICFPTSFLWLKTEQKCHQGAPLMTRRKQACAAVVELDFSETGIGAGFTLQFVWSKGQS